MLVPPVQHREVVTNQSLHRKHEYVHNLKERNNSTEELLSKMGDGYIVNSVMGAHTANPTSGDFSVTTSSILKVEEGEVVGALNKRSLRKYGKSPFWHSRICGDVRPRGSYSSGSVYVSDVLLHEGVRINPA